MVARALVVLFAAACAALLAGGADAHARLVCPPPRSPETGAKQGACGGFPDDPGLPPTPLQPGLQTIVWEESIYHYAAPARLALSWGGDAASDFEECVLLDHIPHGDAGLPLPSYLDESTWVPYAITVLIPDVKCGASEAPPPARTTPSPVPPSPFCFWRQPAPPDAPLRLAASTPRRKSGASCSSSPS